MIDVPTAGSQADGLWDRMGTYGKRHMSNVVTDSCWDGEMADTVGAQVSLVLAANGKEFWKEQSNTRRATLSIKVKTQLHHQRVWQSIPLWSLLPSPTHLHHPLVYHTDPVRYVFIYQLRWADT